MPSNKRNQLYRSLIYLSFVALLATAFIFVSPRSVRAASERVTIGLKETVVDGNKRNDIGPGTTACLEPGKRTSLKFINIKGVPDKTILITNCDGKVEIGGGTYGLAFEDSAYIKVDGSGDSRYRYGIVLTGNVKSTAAVSFGHYSSHLEIANIEIANPKGFAGIMVKTDRANDKKLAACSQPVYDATRFVLSGVNIHDNYIHDTGGEGMYIGETKTDACSHDINGILIYNNIVKNTGWDGIQIANGNANVDLYGNTIDGTGLKATSDDQKNGLQVGLNTAGRYHGNTIKNTGSNAAIILTDKNLEFYGNTISNTALRQSASAKKQGIFIHSRCDDKISSISCSPKNSIVLRDNNMSGVKGFYFNVYNPNTRTIVDINHNSYAGAESALISKPLAKGVSVSNNLAK